MMKKMILMKMKKILTIGCLTKLIHRYQKSKIRSRKLLTKIVLWISKIKVRNLVLLLTKHRESKSKCVYHLWIRSAKRMMTNQLSMTLRPYNRKALLKPSIHLLHLTRNNQKIIHSMKSIKIIIQINRKTQF